MSRASVRLLAAFGLAAVLGAPAFAQPAVNAALVDIVRSWIRTTDLPQPVKDYGESCLLPRLVALPTETKQTIVDAGNLDDGVDAADLYDVVQECTEAMLVGEMIWSWVTDGAGVADAFGEARAICVMEAVRPIPTDAKLTLFEAFDFDEGLATLREEQPVIADELDQRIAACG